MPFEVKQASRSGVKPLVGFYGKSGSGKTMSALKYARGIVGPKGRITLIDTENGRGSLFADVIEGGYSVIDLDAPFSPERYVEAIEAAEKVSDCIVVDSMTHEWSGEGGVIDFQEAELDRMAGDNWGKREACKMASWIKPKLAHKRMVMRLLRCRCALICCLRGEEKTKMVKENGKNAVVTDDFSTPLFDSRFIFEMLVNFETLNVGGQGGFVHVVKCTHPAIAGLLPKPDEQVKVSHGAALAAWCAAPSANAPTVGQNIMPLTPPKAPGTTDAAKSMKAKLWEKALQYCRPETEVAKVEAALRALGIIGKPLKDLSLAEMGEAIDKIEVALSEVTP